MSTQPTHPGHATPPAPTALPAQFVPAEHEAVIRDRWEAAKAFHADPQRVLSGEAQPYAIVIPPPNVTAALHLGHALNNTLQDILARTARMRGFETLWMPGTDHAGIATQAVVEKRVQKEEKKRRKDFTREAFVAKIQAFKDEYEATITGQLKAMGCSCDWARQRFTMDQQCARAVYEAFFRLFKDGLIYRGKRLVNWDPELQTAVADDECYDHELDGAFYYLRYPLVHAGTQDAAIRTGGRENVDPVPVTWGELARRGYPGAADQDADEPAWVTVATTRPETYLADTAVGINPHDPRARALRGLFVELPLVGRIIPVIEDSYVVLPKAIAEQLGRDEEANDPKAGMATGFLKVTPGHDPNDYEIGRRHGLPVVNMMSPDGRVSGEHDWDGCEIPHNLLGKKMAEARKMVVEEFKSRNLLESTRPHRHSLKHSDRSKAIIEPYLSDQWYVKVTDPRMAKAANEVLDKSPERKLVRDAAPSGNTVTFHPPRYAKTYQQWHDNIRDWCISRQLWWGHRIPVWTCRAQGEHTQGPHDESRFRRFDELTANALQNYSSALGLPGAWNVRADRSNETVNALICCSVPATAEAVLSRLSGYRELENERINQARKGIEDQLGEVHQRQLGRDVLALIDVPFTRDPDVLDTWFSSALWPMSTMGWPEKTPLLQAFNPTTTLCTAREIITLWVSRMVMFNRYFLPERWPSLPPSPGSAGEGARRSGRADEGALLSSQGDGRGPVPFHNVVVHAVIQDGEGRKMSKTLGNGVDPLDVIATHGSDAMRFTLVHMTTQTQDVRMPVEKDSKSGRNTSRKFDLGRSLVNKLWNATTGVALRNMPAPGAPAPTRPVDIKSLSTTDRWLLSRLEATVRAVNAAIDNYEYSDYANALYDFIYRDLCDWYLEAVKPTLKNDPNQQAVLARTIDAVLRLTHPAMPYITEALWPHVKNLPVAPISEIALTPSRKGDLLCTAGWPTAAPSLADPAAEAEFDRLRAFVTAVREVRSEHKVPPKRRITAHVPASLHKELSAGATDDALSWVYALAGISTVRADNPPAGSPAVRIRVLDHDVALTDLADAIDANAEAERKTKEISEKRKEIDILQARLNNPGYVERAPAKLIEETKSKLQKLQNELASLL
ncbi:MAG TPA: valine--tRNA ligase [Phycisphaerales bacterium]|nr:valine--tRNA ligase [Phycisphaerales bacterium]